jgi:NTE family protein
MNMNIATRLMEPRGPSVTSSPSTAMIASSLNGPKTSLVLGSGGIMGLAYAGAFKALEDKGISLREFTHIYGTSVGGLLGLCVCLGMSWKAIHSLCLRLPASLFFDVNSSNILRFPDEYGLDTGRGMRQFIRSVCQRTIGIEKPNFFQLYQLTRKSLTVNAVDIQNYQEVLFSYETTPTVLVEDAIRATTAIPFIYTPVKIGQQVLVDGGLTTPILVHHLKDMDAPRSVILNVNQDLKGNLITGLKDMAFHVYHTIVQNIRVLTLQTMTDTLRGCYIPIPLESMDTPVSNELPDHIRLYFIQRGYESTSGRTLPWEGRVKTNIPPQVQSQGQPQGQSQTQEMIDPTRPSFLTSSEEDLSSDSGNLPFLTGATEVNSVREVSPPPREL